jgi:apoptotic protease-activating factor
MHKRQVKALLTVRPEICRDLIVIYVIDSLITKRIFTNEEKNHILRSSQTIGDVNCPQFREEVLKRQTESFLNLLTQKVEENANAFDGFVNILYKDDNYPWIAKKLQQALEDLLFKESNIEIDANQIKTISHDVPNQVKNLLKRQQKIEEIRDELKAFALKGNGWLVLYGMGGSGKSVLAAEAVREWDCDDYKDGIWWTNCGQMLKDNKFDYSMLLLKLQFLWDRFCENYSYKHQKFECVESAVHKIKSFLNSHRKSLLVLDDVWNKEVLENFDFGVPVLFTARDITSDIIPPKFSVKKLKTIDNKDYGLSTSESRQLLAFWVNADPNDLHNEYVNKIIEKLKGNPLCLTLIGNCMEDKGNDSQFWKFYEESIENSREQRSPRRRSSSGRLYLIYESFGFESLVKHSYDALTEEMRNYFKYFALFLEDIRIPVKV